MARRWVCASLVCSHYVTVDTLQGIPASHIPFNLFNVQILFFYHHRLLSTIVNFFYCGQMFLIMAVEFCISVVNFYISNYLFITIFSVKIFFDHCFSKFSCFSLKRFFQFSRLLFSLKAFS